MAFALPPDKMPPTEGKAPAPKPGLWDSVQKSMEGFVPTPTAQDPGSRPPVQPQQQTQQQPFSQPSEPPPMPQRVSNIPATPTTEPKPEPSAGDDFTPPIETQPASTIATDQIQDPQDPDLTDPSKPLPASENIKRLKTALSGTKKTLKEKETEAAELKRQLDEYNQGLVQPQVIEEKDREIEKLKKYQYIVDFKASPEYEEKYVKPLNTLTEQLYNIAQDYEIPKEVMQQALASPNRAELNQFLSQHFDPEGAREVKEVINNLRNIEKDVKYLESNSVTAFDRIRQENTQLMEKKHAQRKERIAKTSHSSFAEVLQNIRKEGTIPELILHDNDPEHNKTYVEPVLRAAATEYGKMVTMLANSGLEDLPKPLATYLARTALLSHASGIAIKTRNAALQQLTDMEKNQDRNTSYVRPRIGSGTAASAPQPMTNPGSGTAGSRVLNSIGIR